MSDKKKPKLSTRSYKKPGGVRQFKLTDPPTGIGNCLYCGCMTNAKLRRCCPEGYKNDGGALLDINVGVPSPPAVHPPRPPKAKPLLIDIQIDINRIRDIMAKHGLQVVTRTEACVSRDLLCDPVILTWDKCITPQEHIPSGFSELEAQDAYENSRASRTLHERLTEEGDAMLKILISDALEGTKKRLIKEYCGGSSGGFECGVLGHQCDTCKKGDTIMTEDTIQKSGFNPDHYPEVKETKED